MIARLTGRVLSLDSNTLVLDVNGVGYEIEVSSFTANSFELDNIVTLETHLIVREDAQILFGFKEASEKKLFQTLIKINGVGPKTCYWYFVWSWRRSVFPCDKGQRSKNPYGFAWRWEKDKLND